MKDRVICEYYICKGSCILFKKGRKIIKQKNMKVN